MQYSEEFMLDSLFLGTSNEKATQLRQDPTIWEQFIEEVQGNQQQLGNIMNLRHLTSLHLDCTFDYTPQDGRSNPPIISPLVIKLGFMHLPQLDYLTLKRGFSVDMKEIATEWLEQSISRTLVLNSSNDE